MLAGGGKGKNPGGALLPAAIGGIVFDGKLPRVGGETSILQLHGME